LSAIRAPHVRRRRVRSHASQLMVRYITTIGLISGLLILWTAIVV
jgi:hypothetical protein